MKNKYGIGFFSTALICILALTMAYQFSFQKAKERAQKEAQAQEARAELENTVKTEGQARKEECYYLMEVNGYVVVYLSDRTTPYEYTDILYDTLPELLQEEIRNGKYMENAEELYGFLENYSS